MCTYCIYITNVEQVLTDAPTTRLVVTGCALGWRALATDSFESTSCLVCGMRSQRCTKSARACACRSLAHERLMPAPGALAPSLMLWLFE